MSSAQFRINIAIAGANPDGRRGHGRQPVGNVPLTRLLCLATIRMRDLTPCGNPHAQRLTQRSVEQRGDRVEGHELLDRGRDAAADGAARHEADTDPAGG